MAWVVENECSSPCELDGYHLFHAIYADLLQELGQPGAARAEKLRALALTHNPAEQSLLRRRLAAEPC